MASMILNASRAAASAARSAASRSGLVAAAASDPLLPRRSSLSYHDGSNVDGLPPYHIPGPSSDKVEFVAREEDLESDKAIWALYERWCKAFNQERSPDEMACRFYRFKQTVLRVDSTRGLNRFADGKNITLVRPKVPIGVSRDRVRRSVAMFKRADIGKEPEGASEGAGEFQKEP